jgi:transcription elongation factor Elf1
MEVCMNLVNNNFRNPLGNNLGGVAVQALPGLRGFVDWLVLSRAAVPYFTENVSVPRVQDAYQRWYDRIQKIVTYFEGERRPIFDPEACSLSIQKDGFYNKNVCLFKNDCAFRLVSSVFAKLENTDRCTLDGDEERVVVTCNVCGKTNSTRPKPNWDETIEVVGRSNWCFYDSMRDHYARMEAASQSTTV